MGRTLIFFTHNSNNSQHVGSQMFGQSCLATEGRRSESESLATMHGDTSRGSEDANKTDTNTRLHDCAEFDPDGISNPFGTASVYFKHSHWPSEAASHLYASVPRLKHMPNTFTLLLGFRSAGPSNKGHPHGASQLQRVGIGLAVSILSVAWAGVFERFRRNFAISHGYEANFLTAMPELSAYWLLIQYCLIGIAEVFCIVGLLEFLYEEAPDVMRSIGSAYAALAGGLGCFAVTIVNNIVNRITGEPEKFKGWLSQNINGGRFNYLYWHLTIMSIVNFSVFLFVSSRYRYRKGHGSGSKIEMCDEMVVPSKNMGLMSADNSVRNLD